MHNLRKKKTEKKTFLNVGGWTEEPNAGTENGIQGAEDRKPAKVQIKRETQTVEAKEC